jgi:hypothetical protein
MDAAKWRIMCAALKVPMGLSVTPARVLAYLLERSSRQAFEQRGVLVSCPSWAMMVRDLNIAASPTLAYALKRLKQAGLIQHVHRIPVKGVAYRSAYELAEPPSPAAAAAAPKARSLLSGAPN